MNIMLAFLCSYSTKNCYQNYLAHMDIHNYNTRSKSHFRVHYGRTNFSHSLITYQGPKLWNDLPPAIRDCISLNSFKRKLKKDLIRKYTLQIEPDIG